MIGNLIANYGELGMQGVLVILVVWLIWYLIRSIMGMFKNELKDLHKDSVKNAELNQKSINLLNDHAKESRTSSLKLSGILKNLLKSSNGNNPAINGLIKRMDDMEKVKVE